MVNYGAESNLSPFGVDKNRAFSFEQCPFVHMKHSKAAIWDAHMKCSVLIQYLLMISYLFFVFLFKS